MLGQLKFPEADENEPIKRIVWAVTRLWLKNDIAALL